MTFELLKQGAEARILVGKFLDKPTIVKERFSKKYRHPDLDERLTKERLRGELKGIMRCKNIGIQTPAIYFVCNKTNSIYMEHISDAETVNHCIGNLLKHCGTGECDVGCLQKLKNLAAEIGMTVGKMHQAGIIHGDLTTSNILVKSFDQGQKYSLVLIDFGLSHLDNSAEDKGVDLYVLERALTSTHSNIPWFFDIVLEAYKAHYPKGGHDVYLKLEEVRLRGRKRTMVG